MKDTVAIKHIHNTLKLKNLKQFNINPFILIYLSYFFKGNAEYENLAKVLLYPRILGTSITTSFGTQMQKFITEVLGGLGSPISGIDIEFIDKIDGRKKYCQIKSGPNALNYDDVTTVRNHFKRVINISRTNHIDININDMVFCLIYGEHEEKNSFIKLLEKDYPVYIGKEFWYHLTGDINFYNELINAFASVAIDMNMKDKIITLIKELAKEIKKEYSDVFEELK